MDWIIGDLHGEYKTLKRLLKRINKLDKNPSLLLTGDITGRGTDSLSTASWVLDNKVPLILGNHDAYLLTVRSLGAKVKAKDRLEPLLDSKIFDEYCAYLSRSRLYHRLNNGVLLVHAGINPLWTAKDLKAIQDNYASLNTKEKALVIEQSYAKTRNPLAVALRYMTSVRFVNRKTYVADYNEKGNWPSKRYSIPWYLAPRKITNPIVFGHWAALGLYRNNNVTCIDGGAVWGNALIAIGFKKQGGSIIIIEPQQ